MSQEKTMPSEDLIRMAHTVAQMKKGMPRKQRSVFGKEYGVYVQVTKFPGSQHYTAGGRKIMPELRFVVKANRVWVRNYEPGDWEIGLKRAFDDLRAGSGPFEELSDKRRETANDSAEAARPPGEEPPQKKKDIFGRIMGMFTR